MWINFEAESPFAIKIFVGGVNVVSGKPAGATPKPRSRSEKDKLQDYVVVPEQPWIDGIACGDGYVKQFVAMKMGEGYSVEAQITGEEIVGGLQFEVVPEFVPDCGPDAPVKFVVKTLTGKEIHIGGRRAWTVLTLKSHIQDREGIPPDQQRLISCGKELADRRQLGSYNIEDGAVLHLVLKLRGGGHGPIQMALAAGGMIKQRIRPDCHRNWDKENTIVFNVQILTTAAFEAITGRQAPSTPVTAGTYASNGYPFFKMYEEKSQVYGDFSAVKSIAEIDGIKEADLKFPHKVIGDPANKQGGSSTPVPGLSEDDSEMSEANDLDEDDSDELEGLDIQSMTSTREKSIINPAGPCPPGFRTITELIKEFEELTAESFESDEDI